jgi:hypothetical protein
MTGRLGATVVAVALTVAQTAFAADASAPLPVAPVAAPLAPLAPGQAAGVHTAQTTKQLNGIAIGAGLLLGAVAIYLIVGTHYHVPPQSGSASGTN